MRRVDLNPIHDGQILGLLSRNCCPKLVQTDQEGVIVAGPLRRKVAAVLALAIGFGVVTGTSAASAASSTDKHVAPTTGTSTVVKMADWWW